MYDARKPQVISVGTLGAKTLTATGVFAYSDVLLEPCTVSRLMLKITTAVVSPDNACVVSFRAQPTYGSSSSAIALGAVSISVAGAAVNRMYYLDVADISVPAGYQIIADVTTAAAGSGAAGAGLAGYLAQYSPEVVANEGFFESA